jgi:hypothetical protein
VAAHVTIEKQWRDDCEVVFLNDHYEYEVEKGSDAFMVRAGALTEAGVAEGAGSSCGIHVYLPEMFDVKVVAEKLNLKTVSKSHGYFEVVCEEGKLDLEKVRGSEVNLHCGDADVVVRKLLEGNSLVECRTFDAKMVNGDEVDIHARGGVQVGAMYAKVIRLAAPHGGVSVGSMHGNATITAGIGPVKLSGLDGSAVIEAKRGNVSVQVNKLNPSRGTVVRALSGSVEAMVAPTIATKLTASTVNSSSRSSITMASTSFQGDATETSVDGELLGEDLADDSSQGVGKINLTAASQQSLFTHMDQDEEGSHAGALAAEASLHLEASGHIRIETTSWIDSIRRKYFADGEGPTLRGASRRN